MEQLILILLIALISFVNWVIKKSAELREKRRLERQAQRGDNLEMPASPDGPADASPEPPSRGDDDSMRRLMEALGLPPDEAPPPVARRPAAPPPLPEPVVPAALPPAPVSRRAPTVSPTPPVGPSRHAKRTPLRSAPVVAQLPAPQGAPFREVLASSDGLRKAIILSEVLGPPKALRN